MVDAVRDHKVCRWSFCAQLLPTTILSTKDMLSLLVVWSKIWWHHLSTAGGSRQQIQTRRPTCTSVLSWHDDDESSEFSHMCASGESGALFQWHAKRLRAKVTLLGHVSLNHIFDQAKCSVFINHKKWNVFVPWNLTLTKQLAQVCFLKSVSDFVWRKTVVWSNPRMTMLLDSVHYPSIIYQAQYWRIEANESSSLRKCSKKLWLL